MLRAILFILPLAVLAAGGWLWLRHDIEAEAAAAPARVAEAHDRIGLRRLLTEHDALVFADLVIGTSAGPGRRDFRGRLERDGRLMPAYGQARRLCARGQHAPDCWEITHLEIDGRTLAPDALAAALTTPTTSPAIAAAGDETSPWTPTDGAPARLAAADPPPAGTTTEGTPPADAAGAGSDDEDIQTGDIPVPAAAETAAPAPLPAAEPPAPSGPPAVTHRVARAVINTRSGPSIDDAVVMRLTAGAELALVESRGDWGQFVVLDGAREGPRVWAALRILEAVH